MSHYQSKLSKLGIAQFVLPALLLTFFISAHAEDKEVVIQKTLNEAKCEWGNAENHGQVKWYISSEGGDLIIVGTASRSSPIELSVSLVNKEGALIVGIPKCGFYQWTSKIIRIANPNNIKPEDIILRIDKVVFK